LHRGVDALGDEDEVLVCCRAVLRRPVGEHDGGHVHRMPAAPRVGEVVEVPADQQGAGVLPLGLDQRDIAAQLFLSPRTVAYHLYKAYPKLGVRSRSDLAPLISR
jgi:hypothetical protein